MDRAAPRRRIEALDRMAARPGAPVSCPDCGTGTPVAEDVRGAADPDAGSRFIRCTRRGDRGEARVRFGRPASAPGA